MKLVCRTDLLTTKMLKDTNPVVQDTVHVLHEDASYDKDVVEIKLPDGVVTSDYGGNFVKDVCIDDGQPLTRKLPEEKVVDANSSLKYDDQMVHANGAPKSREKDCSTESAHELKPEIVQPVGFAPDSNNEKQSSSREEQDPEGRSKATDFGEISEEKINLQELLRLESAEESQDKTAVSSETSKKQLPSLPGEAVGQVSRNACRGIEATASKTSEFVNNSLSSTDSTDDCTVTTSEECDAEAPPECSTSATADAASTEPTCTLEKTDDASAEPGVDAPSSSSSDIGSSEKSSDENGSTVGEAIPNKVDETAVASASSADIVEPSGANGENKHETAGITDAHDSTKRDEGNSMDSKSPTQAQIMDEEITPDSAKATTSRTANGYAPSEPGSFGPSIMSAPVSHSGHLAYSGSISIRSDSSTTSTRSFAFPVLQRDWISSPVRMAKGERRRARRRHAWRKGLICCKF